MKAQVVSFHCVLRDKRGQVLSAFFNKDMINQQRMYRGKRSDRQTRALMAGIQNVREGERRQFFVCAKDAYGPYDPALAVEVQRSTIRNGFWLRVGSEVPGYLISSGRRRIYRVTHIAGDTVVLDANHPLAGQDLMYEVEIISAREARREDFGEGSGRVLH